MKIALTICYDRKLAEIYSAIVKQFDLAMNMSNCSVRRVNHSNTLIKERAIENQAFMIDVNRTGVDDIGVEHLRSSHVINNNGDYLEPLFSVGEMDLFKIAPSFISKFRKSFSTRQDRMPSFCKSIL